MKRTNRRNDSAEDRSVNESICNKAKWETNPSCGKCKASLSDTGVSRVQVTADAFPSSDFRKKLMSVLKNFCNSTLPGHNYINKGWWIRHSRKESKLQFAIHLTKRHEDANMEQSRAFWERNGRGILGLNGGAG